MNKLYVFNLMLDEDQINLGLILCNSQISICIVLSSDVNDDMLFDAEPRLLVIDAETRLSFSEEKK